MRNGTASISASPRPAEKKCSNRLDTKYLGQMTQKGAWEKAQLSIVHDKTRYEKIVRAFVTSSYVSGGGADIKPNIEPTCSSSEHRTQVRTDC